ncbi:FAD-linked oxidase-like protein [Leucosporidium creatinivorum]|uniref:D-lactate dehydrogenase (cytochrome) n=1 Tax=Leucosporidium creatinivorum TaxID=106004 RepID=A0A1Y2FZY0_9BASI|nr:FAD-linked oxidase-like protein [Leucosporidium creatinivorum]
MASYSALRSAPRLLRRPVPSSIRQLSTRPHPLSSRITPSGPVPAGRTPPRLAPKVQRWSTLTAILLATLTGSATYIVGLQSGKGAPPLSFKEPTQANFDSAVKELESWIPQDCLAQDRDSLVSHGHSDWAAHDPKGLPGAVIYPRNTEDVVRIVKLAAKYSIPLIPYSGGTSLEGHTGALGYLGNPNDEVANKKRSEGIAVLVEDLKPGLAWTIDFSENMGEIVKINADDLDVIVQPGVGYEALNLTLKEQGIPLFFPVDPAPGAQIGGMIGTGASGTNAVRYGTMRENVLNLTVVLANGEVIKTRQRAKKSSVGPDLGKLFIGAEGTLGIVVEATLKLAPKLPSTVAVSSFPDIQAAADAARDLVTGGIGLACIELLDDVMVKAINKKGGGITWDEKPSLFLKFSGTEGQIKSDIERTRTITKKNQGSGFTFAKNEKEADDIWYSRKVALWSAIDYVPGSRCWVTDVCVPMSNFPTLVAETRADIEKEGIVGPVLGHAGDGNFHALLLFKNDEEQKKVDGLVHRMVERAQRLDGTCTGEHGVGFGKRDYIEAELGAGTIELLRQIKNVVDPQNIMNPGKLIPERGSCAGHSH